MTSHSFRTGILMPAALVSLLSACGGGSTEPTSSPLEDSTGRAQAMAAPVTLQSRIAAATTTAQSATNACSLVRPFYWEIGDAGGAMASGSVNSGTTRVRYTSRTPMSYASASKWLYGAYVVQRRAGVLTTTDVQMLTFRSGYTNLKTCDPTQTVDGCLAYNGNGNYNALTDGKFFYNGGHMEKHASLIGLGASDNAGLTAALKSQLGGELQISYSQPQPAGGAYGTPDAYARFLRKLLSGQLLMGQMLGSQAVCTNPAACGFSDAIYTPIPTSESWRYSLGHWVESDPVVGDGAFSSGGALGFYPWIDAGRNYYGILARVAPAGALPSVDCGRLVRKAWTTGTVAQ